jgi:protein-S-isoprenylcysteine O-methyltransferase Ste14
VTAADFFARWRVRLGYLLAIVVLFVARPTFHSIFLGAAVGFIGLIIRAHAAGYLHKQEVLTVTGPYARTRNPLYFGSSLLALGAAIAMRSWIASALLLLYFALVYSSVMRREENELRAKHGPAFDSYVATVPLFFPSFSVSRQQASPEARFSWSQYKKNHEHQAALGFVLLLVLLVIIWRIHTA